MFYNFKVDQIKYLCDSNSFIDEVTDWDRDMVIKRNEWDSR